MPFKLNPEYHILRGIDYKNGTPAIMMMARDAAQDAFKGAVVKGSDKANGALVQEPNSAQKAPTVSKGLQVAPKAPSISVSLPSGQGSDGPAVPKGFLNAARKSEPSKASKVSTSQSPNESEARKLDSVPKLTVKDAQQAPGGDTAKKIDLRKGEVFCLCLVFLYLKTTNSNDVSLD